MNELPAATSLRRTIGLPLLTLYGLGTIVGGGFYALIGEVAAHAGMLTPVAFLTAAAIGLLSAFSYAELSARFPVSAGESQYVCAAFERRWLAAVVGWMVILTGVVSAATLARAFAQFLEILIAVPAAWSILAVVITLGAIASKGVTESVWSAIVITLIEVGGLLFVLGVGGHHLLDLGQRWPELVPQASWTAWSGVFLGAYIGFYSFVGFEDMVNMAEEVRHPQRTLPAAIFLALGLTAVLYAAVCLVTVLAVPQAELIGSKSPLSLVVGQNTWSAKALVSVGMLAGVNGALVQIVMAARVGYGLAKQQVAPRAFGVVHPRWQTPFNATLAASLVVLVLALWFPLVTLAKATSTILLAIYAVVNLSLVVVKHRSPDPGPDVPSFPIWLPAAGCLACLAFLVFHAWSLLQ